MKNNQKNFLEDCIQENIWTKAGSNSSKTGRTSPLAKDVAEAKSKFVRCDKCGMLFGDIPKLTLHKEKYCVGTGVVNLDSERGPSPAHVPKPRVVYSSNENTTNHQTPRQTDLTRSDNKQALNEKNTNLQQQQQQSTPRTKNTPRNDEQKNAQLPANNAPPLQKSTRNFATGTDDMPFVREKIPSENRDAATSTTEDLLIIDPLSVSKRETRTRTNAISHDAGLEAYEDDDAMPYRHARVGSFRAQNNRQQARNNSIPLPNKNTQLQKRLNYTYATPYAFNNHTLVAPSDDDLIKSLKHGLNSVKAESALNQLRLYKERKSVEQSLRDLEDKITYEKIKSKSQQSTRSTHTDNGSVFLPRDPYRQQLNANLPELTDMKSREKNVLADIYSRSEARNNELNSYFGDTSTLYDRYPYYPFY